MFKEEQYIEVKELKKTYKCKKVGDIIALNDVSFALPSIGMIFILGKSGSGKSTLLNLLGGLDSFDEGDIVVGGRSMKSFTAKECDTYRNCSIGFIFQENNLFNDYTVARNIELALNLQREKDYGDKVDTVIETVDLKKYAMQKANQLSGGQKQRVAIARALIKRPRILLCDEPTGSLDVETGEEIFQLLKQISLDTLVVVVSHDRESAIKYGDRIIEINDGKILSDSHPLTKHKECPSEKIILSEGQKSFSSKRIIVMGLELLIARPIRLCFCVLICLIAFTCFGIADAVSSYDRVTALTQTMQAYGTKYISYAKQNRRYDETYSSSRDMMNYDDFVSLQKLLNNKCLNKAYDYYSTDCININFPEENDNNYFYSTHHEYFSFGGFTEINRNFTEEYDFVLYGEYPSSYKEVVLTKYTFNGFKKYGYKSKNETYKEITNFEDLIGCSINFGSVEFKVVGILDTCFDEDYYGDFLYREENVDYIVTEKLRALLDCGMHNLLYLSPSYYENAIVDAGGALKSGADIAFAFSPFVSINVGEFINLNIEERKFDMGDGENYFCYKVINDAAVVIEELNDEMQFFRPLFISVSVVMSIISAVFVLYYSSSVVYEKRRDFGIIRALGGSRSDITKIFLVENGLFTMAVIVFSTILSLVGVFLVNALLISNLGVTAVIIKFSLKQFVKLVLISVSAIALGIVIPLVKLLQTKPIDLIAGRN